MTQQPSIYGQVIHNVTAKYPPRHLELRFFPTEIERDIADKVDALNFPHIRPNSVYVASVGCHWLPGVWQKVADMVQFTNEHGVCCWLTEMPDFCVTLPHQATPGMRDNACMNAIDQGFEWLLLIDNDVLPEPDLLLRLLRWNMPVVVPYIRDDEKNKVIASPSYEEGSGLKVIRSAVLSCILIWTKVFNCFPNCAPFRNYVSEPEFFNRLRHYGHRAYQDTDLVLKMATPPSYFGGKETLRKLWRFWEEVDRNRKLNPDRKPIDPKDTRNTYLPWKNEGNEPSEIERKIDET